MVPASPHGDDRASGHWVAIFSDSRDRRRYSPALKSAEVMWQIISDTAQLREPGLVGVVFDVSKPTHHTLVRDTLFYIVARGIPIVVGPRSKFPGDLVWNMKSGVEAAGGIFEIATEESDFRLRVDAVARAASTRWARLHDWFHSRSASVSEASLGFQTAFDLMFLDVACKTLQAPITLGRPAPILPGVKAATAGLRNPESGRVDAELVRKAFGLKRVELAKLLEVTAEALRQTPDSIKHQAKLEQFERIAGIMTILRESPDFVKWLQCPNSELEGNKPIDLIREGRGDVVDGLVQDLLINRGG